MSNTRVITTATTAATMVNQQLIPAANTDDDTDSVIVLCTAPDEATAQQLATRVLNAKLAACVTLIPNVTSFYYWQGKLQQEYEVQMLLKTNRRNQHNLLLSLKENHPYQVPELLVLPVKAGDKEYLSWLNASLN